MASSTLSLDSLSSPSPSPTPPPTTRKPTQSNNTTTAPKAATATMDSDSDLSELTDDDQDATVSVGERDRAVSASAASSSKSAGSAGAGLAEEDDDDGNDAPVSRSTTTSHNRPGRPSSAKRGTHHRTASSTSRRGGGRKKRSSIVPAPMWGWAETKTSASSSAPAEEEEEEMTGPPRAMEEEEEEPEEQEEEEDDFDTDHHGEDSAGVDEEDEEEGFVNPRRLGPYVTQRLPGIRSIHRRGRGGGKGGRGRAAAVSAAASSRKFDDEDDIEVNGDEEDEEDASASGSEYNSSRKKKPAKARGPAPRKRKESGGPESSASEPSKKKKKAQDDLSDAADDATENESDAPAEPLAISGTKPLSSIGSTSASNPAVAALTALAVLADAVDPTEPATREVESINAHAVTSSIMAGSAAELAPGPSVSTSVDPTPAVSRSASPANSDEEQEQPAKKTKNAKRVQAFPRGSPRKGPPADLKVKTVLGDIPDKPTIETGDQAGMEVDEVKEDDKDVEMDADDREEEDEEEGEDEAEETSQRDEDDPHNVDEEVVEAEDEPVDPEAEAENDEDPEQDPDAAEAENEQENDNDEEPSADADLEDQEIEMQPGHRTEALDVLASIELKFAMLRERVYVEKMENLAWEEKMIQASAHPEMQYLQKEMNNRRDKRLELASRKRSYEVANAAKRRKADEDGAWSWWKLSVEDTQTDMIAETNRKRRKLERERRAMERPQPIRRIPLPPPIDAYPLLPPPSLRKILKSYPFDNQKQVNKSRRRHHAQNQPKNLVYPEISTLSAVDIASDLNYLFQNRRIPSSVDVQFDAPGLWGQNSSFTQRNGLGPGSSSMPGHNRSMDLGMGPGLSNGGLSAQSQSMMPPPQNAMGFPVPYDQYGDLPYGPGPPPPGRPRDQLPMGPYPPGPGGPPSGSRDVYGNFPGSSGRNQPQSSSLGPPPPSMASGPSAHAFPMDHEMSTMGPGGGGGHQLMPHHPYFGQGSSGNGYLPPSSHSGGLKGASLNGRRTPSPPPHAMPNGSNSKTNGGYMGLGMGMGSFQVGNNDKGGDRDVRMVHEDEERERLMRERERDRKRSDREKEMDRRDNWDERERDRMLEQQHMQQLQHRSGPQPQHVHPGGPGGPPTPGQVNEPHHHSAHHHRPHHHHVLHRHGPPPPHASSSLPSPGPGPGGVPPIVHSPRSNRDYDGPRPPPGPIQSHPTEVIMLSSNSKAPQPPRDRDWPTKATEGPLHPSSFPNYRDRERDRDMRKPYSQGSPSRQSNDERSERPMATPFMMASSHAMQQPPANGPPPHLNGSGIGSSSSPKGQPMWNTPGSDDSSHRLPSERYLTGPHDAHRSPVQAHRYANAGSIPQPSRGIPPNSSSSIHRLSSPPPPGRARPPPSPSYPNANSHRSPITSPKMRPLSPILSKQLLGPGRTSTPTGHHHPPSASHTPSGPLPPLDPILKNGNYPGGSRTASPLMASLHLPSSGRSGTNGAPGMSSVADRERHLLSPRIGASTVLPPSKLSAA